MVSYVGLFSGRLSEECEMWTRLLLKVTAHPEIKKKSCTHYNHRFKGGSFVACKKHFTASRQNSVAAFSYITEEDGWGLVLRREKTTEVKNKMAPHDRKSRGESDLSFFFRPVFMT